MPAFDPVRDAVLNSPVDSRGRSPSLPRRATDLAALLNSHDQHPPAHRAPTSSIQFLLVDDTVNSAEPIRTMDDMPPSSASNTMTATTSRMPPKPDPPRLGDPVPRSRHPPTLPYNPKRKTRPDAVLIPLSPDEIEEYRHYRGEGVARLAVKRKRAPSDEPDADDKRPGKRHTGDVGVVVQHYNSRPDVGVVQRLESPIIGLKAFNNWVKSVLISLYAHPAFEKSTTIRSNAGQGFKRGKVLDMGCGKGGDISKWSKSRAAEVFFADIAAISVDQAKGRWQSMKSQKFDASFAAIDCFSEPLSRGFPPEKLSVPFDVVSMQFCMHYAFETVEKARCMLDNVSRYLRRGGVFVGTIPNSELLFEQLDSIPREVQDKSFGNDVYKITFENLDERPTYGHRYWFYLKDAVENVPEYVVRWDNFVQLASEYGLRPIYREEFHSVFTQNQHQNEFKPLLVRMKVVDAQGVSAMDDAQWEAANIYIAFAFEKQ